MCILLEYPTLENYPDYDPKMFSGIGISIAGKQSDRDELDSNSYDHKTIGKGCPNDAVPLNSTFKHGLFVAMSDDKTFHFYRWEDIAGKELKVK